MSEPQKIKKDGMGRPAHIAPTNVDEVLQLMACESVKDKPNSTKGTLWKEVMEGFKLQEQLAAIREQLTAEREEKAALQAEITSLRDSLAASQAQCESLAVPHDAVERMRSERDSALRDAARAGDNLILAVKSKNDAIASRDAALSAQRTAEQAEARIQQYLSEEFKRVIEPLAQAARMMGSSIDGREQRVMFLYHVEELKRLHSEAIARPVTPAITPAKQREATEVERRKALDVKTEQERLENLQQPRSPEPSAYETSRERAIPRAWEPEPVRQITGGAEFADWVS